MECSDVQGLLGPFLLDAVDEEERRALEDHLTLCSECNAGLRADGDTVAQLAFTVPQVGVPPSVKQRLMERVSAEAGIDGPEQPVPGLSGALRRFPVSRLPRTTVAASGLAAALVVVVAAGIWFNSRISDIAQDAQALDDRVAAVATQSARLNVRMNSADDSGSEIAEALRDQRSFMYEALEMSVAPGTSVSTLQGTNPYPRAHGLVLVSNSGSRAVLITLDLPSLPAGQVYQAWLVKGNDWYGAGTFTVDATGFGQTILLPLVAITEFDGIGITIEPAGGSAGPTSESVLEGPL